MEDKNTEDDQALKGILKSLDKVFSMVFVLEMVLKVTAYGPKKYLSDAWCWLDFIIVAVKEYKLSRMQEHFLSHFLHPSHLHSFTLSSKLTFLVNLFKFSAINLSP